MKEGVGVTSSQIECGAAQRPAGCVVEEETGDFQIPSEQRQSISKCVSAEDFFDFFRLPYDDSVVAVNRLHILRRFGERLIGIDSEFETVGSDSESATRFGRLREALVESYDEFLVGGALDYRVFRVLQVAGEGVRIPLGETRGRVKS
ncbi:MAG: hypothetical protein HKL81_05445 [Acidimicrobiaceae bacterium]|nr:hypothetical protein [Acidimicrobiaceae bacterium]